MRNNKGFSLVELIVVIAIMAILASVAVIGVSIYVPKAQKAADEQLISDIEYALTMAYYADPSTFTGGIIVLSNDAAPDCGGNTALEAVMAGCFGEGWKTDTSLRLKYDEWVSTDYINSSFKGNETDLLNKVDGLTSSLRDAISEYADDGGRFESFLDEYGVNKEDPDAISDATVLYVAKHTTGLTAEQKAKYVSIMSGLKDNPIAVRDLVTVVNSEVFGSEDVVSAAAAVYAFAEAYCAYANQFVPAGEKTLGMEPFADVQGQTLDAAAAGTLVSNAFYELTRDVMQNREKYKFDQYFDEGHAAKDAQAYIDVMKTVNGAQDVAKEKLGQDGCFSSFTDVFAAYGDGGVLVFLTIEDGAPVVGNTLKEQN